MKRALYTQAKTLLQIIDKNFRKESNTHYEIAHALNELRAFALESTPENDKKSMGKLIPELKIVTDPAYTVKSETALIICKQLLSVFSENDSKVQAENIQKIPVSNVQRVIPETGKVFIIHGHDIENALKLRILIAERFGLSPIILSEQASKGRSVIEKFEDVAGEAAYAFSLLTPDDFIKKELKEYSQARPNVLFELGWFYGRLGRDRVSMLVQEATAIPSDLDGIVRIQFSSSIEEKIIDIETELHAAGMLMR